MAFDPPLEQPLPDDRRKAVLAMLRQWDEEDRTTDAKELAERQRSWESFKAALNADHSSGRQVYPER